MILNLNFMEESNINNILLGLNQLKLSLNKLTRENNVENFQKIIANIGKEYQDLESRLKFIETIPTNSGTLSILKQDTDKLDLYNNILRTYKWTNSLAEKSAFASSLLTQNSLKRSTQNQKKSSTLYNAPSQLIDYVISNLNRLFTDMSIQMEKNMVNSNCVSLDIVINNVLRAKIKLKSLIIESVNVRSFEETFLAHHDFNPNMETCENEIQLMNLNYSKHPDPVFATLVERNLDNQYFWSSVPDTDYSKTSDNQSDIWIPSKFKIFQKITDYAQAAMLHFYSPLIPELAIKSFMTWLHSFSTLFNSPCKKCGKILKDYMPPVWRDFRTLEPYHEFCRF